MLYGMSIIVYTCMTNLGRKSGSGMSFRNSQNTENKISKNKKLMADYRIARTQT